MNDQELLVALEGVANRFYKSGVAYFNVVRDARSSKDRHVEGTLAGQRVTSGFTGGAFDPPCGILRPRDLWHILVCLTSETNGGEYYTLAIDDYFRYLILLHKMHGTIQNMSSRYYAVEVVDPMIWTIEDHREMFTLIVRDQVDKFKRFHTAS